MKWKTDQSVRTGFTSSKDSESFNELSIDRHTSAYLFIDSDLITNKRAAIHRANIETASSAVNGFSDDLLREIVVLLDLRGDIDTGLFFDAFVTRALVGGGDNESLLLIDLRPLLVMNSVTSFSTLIKPTPCELFPLRRFCGDPYDSPLLGSFRGDLFLGEVFFALFDGRFDVSSTIADFVRCFDLTGCFLDDLLR